MEKASIRVLVVDDYEPWRRFFSTTVQKQPELQVIGEASDGLEAVQQTQQLQPDLILLDMSLPSLNGIEAARQIRRVSPNSKILFISENRSPEIAEQALNAGAGGYVVKSDAATELLPAVEAVLQGRKFLSRSLASHDSNAPKDDHAAPIRHCHEVAFYADDGSLVDGYARFIKFALESGNAVIVIVTEAHRTSLFPRLEVDGVNVPAAIAQGRLIPLDAADVLSRLTVNDLPDPVCCAKVIGDLMVEAAKSVKGKHGRVVVCKEIAPTLLSKGNSDGTIRLEHLWDEITKGYGVQTLCGYLSSTFLDKESSPILEGICAEHTAAHGRELCF